MDTDFYRWLAREEERLHHWEQAARFWERIDEHDHASACRGIAETIRKGDAWRARMRELAPPGTPYPSTAWDRAADRATLEVYGPNCR